LPVILSKLMNTCITFDMKGAGPLITHRGLSHCPAAAL
jgi:hypothetical protein